MEGDHKGRPYRDRHAVGAPLVGALLNVIAGRPFNSNWSTRRLG
jgi:hypothetical protein